MLVSIYDLINAGVEQYFRKLLPCQLLWQCLPTEFGTFFHWLNVRHRKLFPEILFLFDQREGCADTCTTHLCDQELGLHILWELKFLLEVSGESRSPINGTFL